MTGFTDDVIIDDDTHLAQGFKHSSGPSAFYHTQSSVFQQALNLSKLSYILPYQTIDANLVFHNTQSYGCGIHLALDKDTNERLIDLLLKILYGLPTHIDCTIILHKHPYKDDGTLSLHDLRCYLFLSTRVSKQTLLTCRKQLELKLDIAKQKHFRLGKIDFLLLIRTWLTHSGEKSPWPTLVDIHQRAFHTLICPSQTIITPVADRLKITYLDTLNRPNNLHLINCQLDLLATDNPSLLPSFFRPELLFPGPFWSSLTLRPNGTGKTMSYFHNLIFLAQDKHPANPLQQSQSLYHNWGYQLTPIHSQQTLSFLSAFPFCITEGCDRLLTQANLLSTLPNAELARRLPIASDKKGAKRGLLLPTHTNQSAFLKLFDKDNYAINNFNYILISDKISLIHQLQSALLETGLDLGETIYLIDSDISFQKMISQLGAQSIYVHPQACHMPELNTSTGLNHIIMRPSKTWLSLLRSLIKHCYKLPSTVKKHILINGTHPHIMPAILAILETTLPKNTAIGLMVNSSSRTSLSTRLSHQLLQACDTKIILGSSSIQHYTETFSNLFCSASQQLIASFDEKRIPGYDDILLHTGSKYSFHRFKKRSKACRTH